MLRLPTVKGCSQANLGDLCISVSGYEYEKTRPDEWVSFHEDSYCEDFNSPSGSRTDYGMEELGIAAFLPTEVRDVAIGTVVADLNSDRHWKKVFPCEWRLTDEPCTPKDKIRKCKPISNYVHREEDVTEETVEWIGGDFGELMRNDPVDISRKGTESPLHTVCRHSGFSFHQTRRRLPEKEAPDQLSPSRVRETLRRNPIQTLISRVAGTLCRKNKITRGDLVEAYRHLNVGVPIDRINVTAPGGFLNLEVIGVDKVARIFHILPSTLLQKKTARMSPVQMVEVVQIRDIYSLDEGFPGISNEYVKAQSEVIEALYLAQQHGVMLQLVESRPDGPIAARVNGQEIARTNARFDDREIWEKDLARIIREACNRTIRSTGGV